MKRKRRKSKKRRRKGRWKGISKKGNQIYSRIRNPSTEQRSRLQKAAAEEPIVRNEVAELRAFLLEQEQQQGDDATPSRLKHAGYPGDDGVGFGDGTPGIVSSTAANFPPTTNAFAELICILAYDASALPSILAGAAGGRPKSMAAGHSRVLTPFDFPATTTYLAYAPTHQQDNPHIFGPSGSNMPTHVVPLSVSPETRQFGSVAPNLLEAQPADDINMVDVESPQEPGDTSTPNPVDEPMRDADAEVGLGQRLDNQPLHEQVAAEVKREDCGDSGRPTQGVLPSMVARLDQGEIMY